MKKNVLATLLCAAIMGGFAISFWQPLALAITAGIVFLPCLWIACRGMVD